MLVYKPQVTSLMISPMHSTLFSSTIESVALMKFARISILGVWSISSDRGVETRPATNNRWPTISLLAAMSFMRFAFFRITSWTQLFIENLRIIQMEWIQCWRIRECSSQSHYHSIFLSTQKCSLKRYLLSGVLVDGFQAKMMATPGWLEFQDWSN